MKFKLPKIKTLQEFITENAKYYHGTSVTKQELNEILKEGLKYTPIKQDNNLPDPIKGNVYLTKNINIALPHSFAKRTDLKHKDLAVIFEINSSDIGDIYADEDEIGNYAVELMEKNPMKLNEFENDFLDLVNEVIEKNKLDETHFNTKSELTKEKRNAIINLGKLIYVKMSREQHKKIANDNYNITVKHTVKVSKAYVVNRKEVTGKITSIKEFLDKSETINN